MKQYCRLYYRIPFSETDAMGIVHHSNHARYLERGRIELLRLTGLSYAELIKRGMQYPVLELHTVFRKPLVFDEIILIETGVAHLTRTRLNFDYRIHSVPELREPSMGTEAFSGAPSVLGESHHCCVNPQGRPVEAAADVLTRLTEIFGASA